MCNGFIDIYCLEWSHLVQLMSESYVVNNSDLLLWVPEACLCYVYAMVDRFPAISTVGLVYFCPIHIKHLARVG